MTGQSVRRFGADERRARLQRRHRLGLDHPADSAVEAASSVVVLHATDPATVYLSVLARCPDASLDDVSAALYDDRSLVKLIGMRRTMFVAPVEYAPVVHSAAGVEIARRLRARLIKELSQCETDPPIGPDPAHWLTELIVDVERLVDERGEDLASRLSQAEPRLRTKLIPAGNQPWDVPATITSRVLTLMGADGRLFRGRPAGTWLSRQHRWSSVRRLWPDGMPESALTEAHDRLARDWLAAFGPSTVADLKWWTGWGLTQTRAALARIGAVEVIVDEGPGVALPDDLEPSAAEAPAVALLPALDPTAMGWQQRDFYLGEHRAALFDRNGNIGPTVWWGGRIVGGWAIRQSEVVWKTLEDVGAETETAIQSVASSLQGRLEGATVIPSFRTPLEIELSQG